ncbi:hypothetical protein CH063_14624, partial [Colletotrichum higginsianum]
MATLLESLAAPYFHSTHPFLRLDKLEVGALYIMISIPLPIFMGRKKHVYEAVMSTDPDFPFDTYEGMVSDGLSSEEFYWDLYWHTSSTPRNEDTPEDEGGGVLYRLRKEPACPQTVIYEPPPRRAPALARPARRPRPRRQRARRLRPAHDR